MVLSKDIKFAICFGLIIGALISICNMCFAAEEISFDGVLNNTNISSQSVLVESSSNNVYFLAIEPGYKYTLTSISGSALAFGDSLAIGTQLTPRQIIAAGDTFEFTYSEYSFVYVLSTATNQPRFTITREELDGLNNFVDQFAYSMLNDGLLKTLWYCVPLIAIGVFFSLGVYFIIRLLYKIIRLKGGI